MSERPHEHDPDNRARVLGILILEFMRRGTFGRLAAELRFAESVPSTDVTKKSDQTIITGILAHVMVVIAHDPDGFVDLARRSLRHDRYAGGDNVVAAMRRLANTGKLT